MSQEERIKKLEKKVRTLESLLGEQAKLLLKESKQLNKLTDNFSNYGDIVSGDIKDIKQMIKMLEEFFIDKSRKNKDKPYYIG